MKLDFVSIVKETDISILNPIKSSISQLDQSFHIGYLGRIQEWKLDVDIKKTCINLSNLMGWYGWYPD